MCLKSSKIQIRSSKLLSETQIEILNWGWLSKNILHTFTRFVLVTRIRGFKGVNGMVSTWRFTLWSLCPRCATDKTYTHRGTWFFLVFLPLSHHRRHKVTCWSLKSFISSGSIGKVIINYHHKGRLHDGVVWHWSRVTEKRWQSVWLTWAALSTYIGLFVSSLILPVPYSSRVPCHAWVYVWKGQEGNNGRGDDETRCLEIHDSRSPFPHLRIIILSHLLISLENLSTHPSPSSSSSSSSSHHPRSSNTQRLCIHLAQHNPR